MTYLNIERITLIFFTSLGIASVLIGYLNRSILLQSNLCKMTYSKISKTEVNVVSTIQGLKLWKFNSMMSRNTKQLNPQPVLFIPGHMGNPDQVRSLASFSHNGDDYFQYFVLDFNNAMSGFHGSFVIKQAIYVNDALKAIKQLYHDTVGNKRSKTGCLSMNQDNCVSNILIVGHSVGGLVARLSILLDNHPQCLVKDMILLSSPSLRPPYSLDASNNMLYRAVNKAWTDSYHNETRACKVAHRLIALHDEKSYVKDFEEDSFVHSPHDRIDGNWDCAGCVRNVKVFSITGGIIDLEVDPSLTQLEKIAPVVQNITRKQINRKKTTMYTWTTFIHNVLNSPRYIFLGIYYCFEWMNGRSVNLLGNTTNTSSIEMENHTDSNNGTCSDEFECSTLANMTSEENTNDDLNLNHTIRDSCLSKLSRRSVHHALENKTLEYWTRDMRTYTEPYLYSLRTSQFADVGYPVDHNAILWCYDFIHAITEGMRKLSVLSCNHSDVDINTIFNLKSQFPSLAAAKKYYNEIMPNRISYCESQTDELLMEENSQQNLTAQNEYEEVLELMNQVIPPIANVKEREMRMMKFDEAKKDELLFMRTKFNESITRIIDSLPSVLKLSFVRSELFDHMINMISSICIIFTVFYTSYLHLIWLMFTFTSILMFMVRLSHQMSGILKQSSNHRGYILNPWNLLNPYVHFHINCFQNAYKNINDFLASFEISMSGRSLQTWLSSLIWFLITCWIIIFSYRFVFYPDTFVEKYIGLFSYILAYCAALALRVVLTFVVDALRVVLGGMLYAISIILRFTIYCSPVRKPLKRIYKTVLRFICGQRFSEMIYKYLDFTVVVAVVIPIGIIFTSWQRCFGNDSTGSIGLGLGNYLLCFMTVLSSIYLMLMIISTLLVSQSKAMKIENSDGLNMLCNIYCIAPLFCMSSVLHSWELLYGNSASFGSALLIYDRVFGPERIHFCLSVIAIIFHFIHSRKENYFESLGQLKVTWMEELFGDRMISVETTAVIGTCVHEDGGRAAIFENIEHLKTGNCENLLVEIRKDIIMGPTYRVISCACYKDRKLKNISEWCEWCRCSHCGGKSIPKDAYRSQASSYDLGKREDFTIDLFLLMGLLATIFITFKYLASENYYLYAFGTFAAMCVIREVMMSSDIRTSSK